MEVTGEVIRVEVYEDADSKAGGLVEYHLIADTWKCI